MTAKQSMKNKNIQWRGEIDVFPGGQNVDLSKKDENGVVLKEKLTADIAQAMDTETENQQERIDKISKWQKMFKGIRKKKDFPYPNASNFAVPLTRWLTETILVRIINAIFSQRRFWIVEAEDSRFEPYVRPFEDALEWWQKSVAKLKDKSFSPLMQCIKTGTGLVNMAHIEKNRAAYRLASEQEVNDKDTKIYKDKDGNYLVKDIVTKYNGVAIYPVSREDWIQSSDAIAPEDAFMCGFRKYLRPSQFQSRINRGEYPEIDEQDSTNILTGGRLDDTKISRAEDQYKLIQDNLEDKIDLWQLNVKYDVDNDGEEDDIIVLWNDTCKKILKCIYTPYFYGERPYLKFIASPVEYSADGEGTCEIVESMQNEIDTYHNQRVDRGNQLNAPVWLRRTGNVKGDIPFYPGAVVDCDDPNNDVKPLLGHGAYPDTAILEATVAQYAMQAVGVSAVNMGQSTANRPVARESLLLAQEANKKIQFMIDNIRRTFSEMGIKVLEMMSQFTPVYTYKTEEKGVMVKKILEFPPYLLRDGIKIKLAASSEMMNIDVRREINLTLYQLLSDYFTKMTGMANAMANPQVPMAVKKFMADVAPVSTKLIKEIVRDFGKVNEDELVPGWDEDFYKALGQPSQAQQMQQKQAQMAKEAQQIEMQKQQADLMKGQQNLQGKQMDLEKGKLDLLSDKMDLQKGTLAIEERAHQIAQVLAETEKEKAKK